MMDNDSDYSDYSDVEEDFQATSKRQGGSRKSGKNCSYRITNALKVPRATTYTAQALYDQIHSSDINLEPEYQRAVVWPEAKQIGIIDSILRNFYIPPVIFCVNALDDGTETKTCIDGKQRLTSIHRFMSGLIPHRDPFTHEKLWYKDDGSATGKGPRRKLLPDKYRRVFANKQIVCVEYQDITDSDEREIFQRVQLGMALTPAEKIQVISSPRASFIRELQATYLQESGGLTGESLNWDRSRGGDFRSLAQSVFCIEKYPTSAFTITPLEKWLTQPDAEVSAGLRERVHKAFGILLKLVQDERLSKAFQKPAKVAPVEIVMIMVLIATHMRTMGLTQLSNGIAQMREDVRKHHVDVRANDRVARTMLEFVQGLGMKTEQGGDVMGAGAEGGSNGGELVVRKRKRVEENGGVVVKEAGEITEIVPGSSRARSPGATSVSKTPVGGPVDRLAVVRMARQSTSTVPSQPPMVPPPPRPPSITNPHPAWMSSQHVFDSGMTMPPRPPPLPMGELVSPTETYDPLEGMMMGNTVFGGHYGMEDLRQGGRPPDDQVAQAGWIWR